MNVKRVAFAAVIAIGLGTGVAAQQITRVAVMDFNRILAARSKDSAALREFELKKSTIQAEIDRRKDDIMRLVSQKIEADKANDAKASSRLRSEIDLKTKQLSEFATVKQRELDEDAKKLVSNDQFAQLLYKEVQTIAESEGYSLVLNIRSADAVMESVFWYSQMIDITDKIIQVLALGNP
jgi:outer membrane protein